MTRRSGCRIRSAIAVAGRGELALAKKAAPGAAAPTPARLARCPHPLLDIKPLGDVLLHHVGVGYRCGHARLEDQCSRVLDEGGDVQAELTERGGDGA